MGRLAAKKPCSFGGKMFYIGEEVPESLVADPARQVKLGVLAAVPDSAGMQAGAGSGGSQAGPGGPRTYTQEQVDAVLARAVADAIAGKEAEYAEKAEADRRMMEEAASDLYPEGLERILIDAGAAGEDEQRTAVWALPEEIRQAFAVLQMNAEEGAKAVSGIRSENALILIHAADSRRTVRNAAREQAEKLFPAKDMPYAPGSGGEAAGVGTGEAGT